MKLETLKRQYEPDFCTITTFEDADRVARKLCPIYDRHGPVLYGSICEELAKVEVDNAPLANRFTYRKDARTISQLAIKFVKDYKNSHILGSYWLEQFGPKIWPGHQSLLLRDNGIGVGGSLMFSTSVGGLDFLVIADTDITLAELEWKTNVCNWKLTFKVENLQAYYENHNGVARYIVIIHTGRGRITDCTIISYDSIKRMWTDYYREKPGDRRALACEPRYEVAERKKKKIAVQLYNQDVLSPTEVDQRRRDTLSIHARPYSDYGIRTVKWDVPLPPGYQP